MNAGPEWGWGYHDNLSTLRETYLAGATISARNVLKVMSLETFDWRRSGGSSLLDEVGLGCIEYQRESVWR